MPKLGQVSLTGGEISPSLHARVDLARYATSLKTCRNFCVSATGGVFNRAGTEFVAELNADSLAALIPFVYSVDQAYMLVFQEETIQVYADGGFVESTVTKAITNITIAFFSPHTRTITTSTNHDLVVGQSVTISDVVATGDYAVGGFYTVLSTPTATTFTIKSAVAPITGSYTSGGTVTIGVNITSPYQSDDLYDIRFTQSADVLTLVHQSYLPSEFIRLTESSFQWAEIDDFDSGPFMDENVTATTVTASAATGTVTLTASSSIFTADHVGALFRIDIEDLSDIPPWEPSKRLAAPTVNPLGLFRRASGKVYQCTTDEVAAATEGTFTGTVRPIHEEGAEDDGDGNPIDDFANRAGVEWTYRHSLYGVCRITSQAGTTATATVLSYLPVVSPKTTTIWSFGAWSEDQGYPALVTYFGDRLVFANTPGQPQTEWASKTSEYHNFSTSSPLVSDDAITQTLNARQINAIVELVPLDQLVAMTATSSFASPRRGETWTPQTIGFDPQSYFGASNIRSIVIGDEAIFAERGAKRLRVLSFELQIDKFGGGELSVLARHLFKRNKTIVDMDYAADPHGILWIVRSDGALIGLTYLKEQDVIGWHRHDTDGFFERVCVIPEDGRDAVYFIVRRTINGQTVRYLERLGDREIDSIYDAFFVDCGLSFDGRNTTSTTIAISGASYEGGAEVTLTASTLLFAVDDIGDAIQFDGVRIRITEIIGGTATGILQTPVPVELQNVASTEWTFARDTFTGLDHLEGETVSILADGSVLAPQVVTDGAITIPNAAGVVHIGLPITAEIETLDVTIFGGDPIRDRAKCIPRVAVQCEDTVGLLIGPDEDNLDPLAMRVDEYYTDPVAMQTDVFTAHPTTTWNKTGRVLIRQTDPLPATILAIFPQVEIGGDG